MFHSNILYEIIKAELTPQSAKTNGVLIFFHRTKIHKTKVRKEEEKMKGTKDGKISYFYFNVMILTI